MTTRPRMQMRPAEILLVEDEENDVLLTRSGFEEARLSVNLHHVEDGEDCLAFLRKSGRYAQSPSADLVLLDINLPRMNGWDVLREIAADPQLAHTPVVVLTTSASEEHVLRSYQLRCSSYIVKPVDFEQFLKVVMGITHYWFGLAILPSQHLEP